MSLGRVGRLRDSAVDAVWESELGLHWFYWRPFAPGKGMALGSIRIKSEDHSWVLSRQNNSGPGSLLARQEDKGTTTLEPVSTAPPLGLATSQQPLGSTNRSK